MDIKGYIKKLERREARRAAASGETWHRKGYHRFFEGYTEYRIRENGKLKLRRVYTADYYSSSQTEKQRRRHGLLCAVVYIILFLLFLSGGMLPAGANRFWMVNIFQLASVVAALLLGQALFYKLTAPEKMEIRIYNSSSGSLMSCARFLCFVLAATAVLQLAYGLMFELSHCLEELAAAALTAAGAALSWLLFLLEKRVEYVRVKNNTKIESGAIDPYEIKGER